MALGTESQVLAYGWEQQVPVVHTADTRRSVSTQYVMHSSKESLCIICVLKIDL